MNLLFLCGVLELAQGLLGSHDLISVSLAGAEMSKEQLLTHCDLTSFCLQQRLLSAHLTSAEGVKVAATGL